MAIKETQNDYHKRLLSSVVEWKLITRGLASIEKDYDKYFIEVPVWIRSILPVLDSIDASTKTEEEMLEQLGIKYKTIEKTLEALDAVRIDSEKMIGPNQKIIKRITSNSVKFAKIMAFIAKNPSKPERCEAKVLEGEVLLKKATKDYNTLITRLKLAHSNAAKLKRLIMKMTG